MMGSLSTILRVSRPYLHLSRFYSGTGLVVSDFASKKKGTGKGPFIELPEFKSLQDSIFIKIPSSCTINGNLKNFSAISPDPKGNGSPALAIEFDETTGLSKLSTGLYPTNLIMTSSAPMSNTAIMKIDSYKNGIFVPDFVENVLCYSGDITVDKYGELKGLGTVVIAGKGPVFELNLARGDNIMVSKAAILAYDSNVKLQATALGSHYNLPEKLKDFFNKYLSQYSKAFSLFWNKLFNRDKFFYRIEGPGLLFLQSQAIPGSRKFTDTELRKII